MNDDMMLRLPIGEPFPDEVIPSESEDVVLRALVEGTASVVGSEFFRSLVRHLAMALGTRYAFIAEFMEDYTRVRTLAYWGPDDYRPNIEFPLDGTPCQIVLQGNLCHYPRRVSELFPRDVGLVRLRADGYLGVPLVNSAGQSLGHLVVFDDRPLPREPRFLSIFRIFAERARAELERLRMEADLAASEHRLAKILATTMDAIVVFDREFRIQVFNDAAAGIFGFRSEEVIGTSLIPLLGDDLAATVVGFVEQRDGRESLWLHEGVHARRNGEAVFPVEATLSSVGMGGLFTLILRDIEERRRAEEAITRLTRENLYLQEEINTAHNFEEIFGATPPMRKVFHQIQQVASSDATVLVIGETGTGKELIARAIHNRSSRRNRPLIKVNCAALSPGLIESEFFGHEKGAFTGAVAQRIGRFELASGGTIFLDEIGEITLEVQGKLLRVLQEQEFERVGGSKTLKVDVRVIAATNRDLSRAVAEGRFRSDLFYRLNVFPLHLPPLRERLDDLALLVPYFANKYAVRIGKHLSTIRKEAINRLRLYAWPGNIRELENIVERAVILSPGDTLEFDEDLFLPAMAQPERFQLRSLEDVERDHILKTLEAVGWVIEGPKGAAAVLDINPNTLRSRMNKLGIRRPSR